ncbi:MAG: restriction endonuclease [Ginsengibacter sp.]
MSQKIVERSLGLLNDLVSQSKEFSDRDIEKIIKRLFIPIFSKEGYTIDGDSMYRHGYLDYIASKDTKKSKQTIGVIFNREERTTTVDDIEDLLAGCTIDGIDSLIFLSNTLKNSNFKEFDKDLYPVKFQHIDYDMLGDWIKALKVGEIESVVVKILKDCTQHIIMAILNDPNTLKELEWLDMERTVAELFRGLGFKAELTPSSKDGGKDVILELEEIDKKKSYVIEVKHWRSGQKVGKSAVNKFVRIVVKENRTAGLFLSTYGVSSEVVESLTKIERKKVKFGDKEKIISLCETYIKTRESGLWLKNLELEKILLQNTL